MNDARYGVGDGTSEEDRRLGPCQNNVVPEQKFCPKSPLEKADHSLMTCKALRKLSFGEECYVDYGENYSFPG